MEIVFGNDQLNGGFVKNGEELEEKDDSEPTILPITQGIQSFELPINLEHIMEGKLMFVVEGIEIKLLDNAFGVLRKIMIWQQPSRHDLQRCNIDH